MEPLKFEPALSTFNQANIITVDSKLQPIKSEGGVET